MSAAPCPVPGEREWTTAPPAPAKPKAEPASAGDPAAEAVATTFRSLIQLGEATSRRNLQAEVGASGVGQPCDRRLAYMLTGTKAVNRSDPTKRIIGTAMHLWLAEKFTLLDQGSGRWLIEVPVSYKGIPGTCDLFDRFLCMVVDWKTTSLRRLADLKRGGVPASYLWQINVYAAGLREQGEDVRQVALVFIPTDGTLNDIWAWTAPFDMELANRAARRRDQLMGQDPSTVPASPDRLCPWCDFYQPNATDLSKACPGKKG